MLPSFSLTGNSCPASSWRPCQHPPLEYFRGKSENDQQPPKRVFSHMPYMGILSRSGCYARVSCSWHPPKHMKYPTTGGTLSARLQPHTHPYPSAATLAHVSPVRLTLTLTHGFTAKLHSRCGQCPFSLRTLTTGPIVHTHPCCQVIQLHIRKPTQDRNGGAPWDTQP